MKVNVSFLVYSCGFAGSVVAEVILNKILIHTDYVWKPSSLSRMLVPIYFV